VNGLSASSSVTHDLGDLREVDRRGKSAYFYFVLLVGVSLSAEAVAILIADFSGLEARGPSTTAGRSLLLALSLTGVCVVYAFLNLPAQFRGADAVRIENSGLTLLYGARSRTWSWTDRSTRVALFDYSAHPRLVRQRRSYHLYIPYVGWSWTYCRRTVIDRAVFEAVLLSARTGGAEIKSLVGSALRYGFPPQIFRITGKADPLRQA
jgi:hypothetical protein